MLKLEGLIAWKISEQSYSAWKKSLEDDGYTDTHLTAGVNKIKDWLKDPEKKLRGQDVNYGTLARACKAVYIEPQPQLQPSKTMSEVTNPNQRGLSPYAKGCCEIIQLLTDKQITPAIFRQKHHELNQKHKIYNVIM